MADEDHLSVAGDRTSHGSAPPDRPILPASSARNRKIWRLQETATLDLGKVQTRQDLVVCLHTVLSSRLPPSLPEVVNFHSAKPRLQSIRSYNIVLAYAYRLSDFKTARKLLAQMRENRFTEKIHPGSTNSPTSDGSEQEFREVIFRGIWSRGGAGRATESRSGPLSDIGSVQDRAMTDISRAREHARIAAEPTAPPERPIHRGSMMDMVYRSVRVLDPSCETNETLKRILLESKVDPQLGGRRKPGQRRRSAITIDQFSEQPTATGDQDLFSRYPSGIPGHQSVIEEAKASDRSSNLDMPRKPSSRGAMNPKSVLPQSIARTLLGSQPTGSTPDLFLAYVRYVLNVSPANESSAVLHPAHGSATSSPHEEVERDATSLPANIPSVATAAKQLLALQSEVPLERSGARREGSQDSLLRLLHLYLQPHLASRFPPIATIEAFRETLASYGQELRPTPRTLTYALSALKRQRARNSRALRLVDLFITNWGEESVGIVSWRLLAKYGRERRCYRSIERAKDGLWQWSKSYRYRSSRARARSFRQATAKETQHPGSLERLAELSTAPASQIHWKLPYIRKNLVKWRRQVPHMRRIQYSRKLRRLVNRAVKRPRKKGPSERSTAEPTA